MYFSYLLENKIILHRNGLTFLVCSSLLRQLSPFQVVFQINWSAIVNAVQGKAVRTEGPHKSETNPKSSVWEDSWICITMKSKVQWMWLTRETYAIEYFFLGNHPSIGVGNIVLTEPEEIVLHLLASYANGKNMWSTCRFCPS